MAGFPRSGGGGQIGIGSPLNAVMPTTAGSTYTDQATGNLWVAKTAAPSSWVQVGGSAFVPSAYTVQASAGSAYESRNFYDSVNAVTVGTGNLSLSPVAVPGGFTIGHLFTAFYVAASGPTHWWYALFDSAYNMLASTADQTSTAQTAGVPIGLAIANIASGAANSYTTVASGVFYVGVFQKASSTAGKLLASDTGAGYQGTPGPVTANGVGAFTGPPAFPYQVAVGNAAVNFWVGVGG